MTLAFAMNIWIGIITAVLSIVKPFNIQILYRWRIILVLAQSIIYGLIELKNAQEIVQGLNILLLELILL